LRVSRSRISPKLQSRTQLLAVGGAAIEGGEHVQGFGHGLKVLEGGGLKLDADGLAIGRVQGPAPVANIAGGRRLDTLQHLQGRGLAGPVGTQKPETAARGNGKAHPIHGAHARVGSDQVTGFDQAIQG
jgi:hypothetical protein